MVRKGKVLFLTILIGLTLSACSTVTTEIIPDDGPSITVKSKSDALVKLEEKGRTVTVDNRGRPGIIEQFLGALILRLGEKDVNR